MSKVVRNIVLTAALLTPAVSGADLACTSDAIVVFDGSASMAKTAPGLQDVPRIVLAREAMHRAMPQIAQTRRLGLVTYGPGGQLQQCANIDLRFPPIDDAAPRMLGEVDALQPDGNTPLTAAVHTAAQALNYTSAPGVVVLVTDGRETCGGSPCQLGKHFAAKAANLTVHVIGFQMQPDRTGHPLFRPSNAIYKPDCLAKETGGEVVTTETVEELVAALRSTLTCPVLSNREAIANKG